MTSRFVKNLNFFSVIFKLTFTFFLISFSQSFGQCLYPVVYDNHVAYINNQGKLIINKELETPYEKGEIKLFGNNFPTYIFPDYAYFSEGKVCFMQTWGWWFIRLGKEYGILDTNGNVLIKPQDHIIWQFKDNIAKTIIQLKHFEYTYGEEYTFINTDGKFCFTHKYSSSDSTKFGQDDYIFVLGKDTLIMETYKYCGDFSDKFAIILQKSNNNLNLKERYNYLSSDGKLLSKYGFDDLRPFSEGKGVVMIDSLWGVINYLGEIILKPSFYTLWEFKDGFARYFDGKLYGFINDKGERVFSSMFIFANNFSDGFAQIQFGPNEYNFIDKNGKKLSEINFDACGNFSNGLASVMINGKWGYIDKKGNIAIYPEYDFAQDFRDGFAQVWQNGNLIILNTNGEKIWNYDFE